MPGYRRQAGAKVLLQIWTRFSEIQKWNEMIRNDSRCFRKIDSNSTRSLFDLSGSSRQFCYYTLQKRKYKHNLCEINSHVVRALNEISVRRLNSCCPSDFQSFSSLYTFLPSYCYVEVSYILHLIIHCFLFQYFIVRSAIDAKQNVFKLYDRARRAKKYSVLFAVPRRTN